jgi:acyl-coenzyme A thioesterase PaaI-like protein
MRDAAQVPAGFEPYVGRSSFADGWRPLYQRLSHGAVEIGLFLGPPHCNSRGIAHGGLIMTLADNAMARAVERAAEPRPLAPAEPRPLAAVSSVVTVHLDVDFVLPGEVGQWLVLAATSTSAGRSLRFAQCSVTAGGELAARASGIYRAVSAGGTSRVS